MELIQSAFDADHYLYDLFDNEEVLMGKIHRWLLMLIKGKVNKNIKNSLVWRKQDPLCQIICKFPSFLLKTKEKLKKDLYSKEEFDKIMSLRKREHLIKDSRKTLLEIIDILYSFCHEFRIMDGELNVESATTINKTSSILHCFCCEDSLSEVIKLGFLKCLTYSLIRNFEVCQKVKNE